VKTPLKQNLYSKLVVSGTYMVHCGGSFYIGSAVDIDVRRRDHARLLRRSRHHSKALQAAFDALTPDTPPLFEVVKEMRGATVAEIRAAEQALLDLHHGSPGCCNTSKTSIGATNPHPETAERWRDPEFREKMRKIRESQVVGPETREKQSLAKRGGNNPHARAVVFTLKGQEFQFGCVTDAAKHFKVKQQVVDAWLKGRICWPGMGPRTCRQPMRRLIGLTGRYADDVEDYLV